MEQVSKYDVVSTAKPYAKRFGKVYLAVAGIVTLGWIVLYAVFMPELLFDWMLGPVAIGTAVQLTVTSTAVAASSVAIFLAGVGYERYR